MEENDKEGQAGCHSCCRKRKTGQNLECSDDDNTPSLADDESVNEADKPVGEGQKCDVRCGNHIEQMTITQEKKDEVSLLSGPSQPAFMLSDVGKKTQALFASPFHPCAVKANGLRCTRSVQALPLVLHKHPLLLCARCRVAICKMQGRSVQV